MAAPSHITSPIVRNVLVGRYAECSIGGLVLVFLFDWEINVESDLVNLTATGDRWKIFVPVDSGWTGRGRGYIAPSAPTSYISAAYGGVAGTGGTPASLIFAGWTSATGGQKIWEGTCYISAGRMTAPQGLFEQEITVRGTAVPTAGLPA
jgi:hypothetical protein